MRGIRGIRRGCPCGPHTVWGVSTPAWGPTAQGVISDGIPNNAIMTATKVPAKYAPYMNSAQGVETGRLPPASDSAFRVSLTPCDSNASIPETVDPNSDATTVGSRVTYVDGSQAFVTYRWSGEDDFADFIKALDRIEIATKSCDSFFLPVDVRYFPENFNQNGFLKPAQWMAGKDYFVSSSYPIVEGSVGNDDQWFVGRYKYADGYPDGAPNRYTHLRGWLIKLDDPAAENPQRVPEGGGLNNYSIALPAIRSYIRTNQPQPDEPWVLAMYWNGSSYRAVTGRWLGNTPGQLNANEVEHVLVELGNTTGIDTVECYNRINGRDLAIFSTQSSANYWMYDGDSLTAIDSERPEFITADKDGNILYGSFEFIRKLGDNGWHRSAPGFRGVGNDLGRGGFQILPGKDWIQLRWFRGYPETASGPINCVVDGVQYAWDPGDIVAEPNNARHFQILNWSVSHNGQVWVPHIQADAPWMGEELEFRALVSRAYTDHDRTEARRVIDPDPEVPNTERRLWLDRYHSNLQTDFDKIEVPGFFPALDVRGSSSKTDFDMAECDGCGCDEQVTNYY